MKKSPSRSHTGNSPSPIRRKLLYLLLFPILLLMLLFPETAASGALSGLALWSQTLLPVLLPFMILSGLFISLEMTRPINRMLSPLLTRLFPVSRAACYPMVLGLLCGMPLGAKTTAELYRSGQITKRDALFLLGFSNHASLMFIISYVSTKELAQPAHTMFFLLIIYFSAWAATACLLPALVPGTSKRIQGGKNGTVKLVAPRRASPSPSFFAALDQSIADSFDTITKVGGYIILFSMLSAFAGRLPLPEIPSLMVSSLLEITNGIHAVCASSLGSAQKTALTIAATTFGGLSGLMQTRSVTLGTGLSIKSYLLLKTVQAVCAYFLALAACHFLW